MKNFSKKTQIRQPSEQDRLTDFSPGDAPWDVHRGQADDVSSIYSGAAEFERYSARISECSERLWFSRLKDPGEGDKRLKLRESFFCRVRYCPVCQWRRSLMWKAKFYKALPTVLSEYPKARWVFMTLTVRNCPIRELGETLTHMNKTWYKFVRRSEFKPVLGWVRTTEVTRGEDGTAHPHFHVLLMVPPSWFTTAYVRQSRWTDVWASCLRVDYRPIVDIRVVKPRKKDLKPDRDNQLVALEGAIKETLKYSTKPSEMIKDPQWLMELTKQTHKRRFIASGGALKNILKDEQGESNEELILLGEAAEEDDGVKIAFNWRKPERAYRRHPKADKSP